MSMAATVSWVSGGSTRWLVRVNCPALGLTRVEEMVQTSVLNVCPVWSAGTSSRANWPLDRKAAESTRTPTNRLRPPLSGPQQSRWQACSTAAVMAPTSALAAHRYGSIRLLGGGAGGKRKGHARATPRVASRAGHGARADRSCEQQGGVIFVTDMIQPVPGWKPRCWDATPSYGTRLTLKLSLACVLRETSI